MQKWGRAAFAGIYLSGFVIIQLFLIQSARKTLAAYREPFLGWSSHSFLLKTNPEAAFDGDLSTFWSDTGGLDGSLYLMFSPGMTHRPGSIPEPDPIAGIELFTGDTEGLGRPARIRLSYFEQQLYQINHDYRFPDPPVLILSMEILLRDTEEGQSIALSLPFIPPSKGFPDQVKQRWIRLEILSLYGRGKNENRAAIREIRLIRREK